jgi:hypothetical protein
MILDEGCAERGCPMHDERETKGVAFIRKEWAGLSDSQLEAIYYEVVAEHRGAPMPWGQVVFAQAVQAALKEKNA